MILICKVSSEIDKMEMKPDKKRTHYGISDTPDSDVLQLPESCRKTIRAHVNTVYVGTILGIYNRRYGPEGQLATAHWSSNNKIYVTLHNNELSSFVDIRYQQWVVDHRRIRPGAFILFVHQGTNDIMYEKRKKTFNEIRQHNSKILMNDTLVDYPTEVDRNTYNCCLFVDL